MTNLALTISNHGNMLGGGEYSFLDLLSNLPTNWKVIAVVPHEGQLKTILQQRGLETHVVPLPAIRPWHFIRILITLRDFLRVCRSRHPALIYANGSRAALYGGIVGRLLHVPVVWHCRVAEADPYLDSLLAKLSTKMVVNSQATARRFSPRFRAKICVVYNGVNLQWLQNGKGEKPELVQDDWKAILLIARASRWKRHDLVLSAFEHVAKSDPKVHLFCLGAEDIAEPKWWNYLQKRTRESAFSERIHWVGHIRDVRPWYQVAHMLVLASDNEPFGRVIVEAMACCVPVIATRSGGIPEILRHNLDGVLISPGDYQQMANAMIEILDNNGLKARLTKSALTRAEFFSLDSHVSKMAQVFEDTINRPLEIEN